MSVAPFVLFDADAGVGVGRLGGRVRWFGGGGASAVAAFGVLVAVFVAVLAVLAPAALAGKEVDRFVGGPAGGALGEFVQPRDMAVNESTGDIYVADDGNNRIQRLAADGTSELVWGKDVIAGNASTGFEVCQAPAQCKTGEEGQLKGELIDPAGIAIDQSDGSVYVWDTRSSNSDATKINVRIQKFDADGNFLLMFGHDVNKTKVDAVAPESERNLCTAASGDVCQAGIAGTDPGQFANTGFNRASLAVSPVDGDVFVADPGNSSSSGRRLQRFNSDGTFESVIGSSSNFGSAQPRHVAVDSQGIVYASDSNGTAEIDRYDSAGVHGTPGFLSSIAVPPLLSGSSTATAGLEVDPDPEGDGATGADTDRLYVLRDPSSGSTVVQQFDSPGEATAPASVADTHGSAAGFTSVNGLGLNSASGDMYVSGAFSVGHGFFILDDDGTGPVAASGVGATNVTGATADLVGTVDAGDGLVSYHFEYSADGIAYLSTADFSLDGSGPVEVTVPVTGLEPSTFYRVRLVVSKIVGPSTRDTDSTADQVFVTAAAPPTVTTLGPAQRTDTSAQLRGLVDPNGSGTTYRFEYGLDGGSFDHQVPIPDGNAGAGNTAVAVAEDIGGLLAGTAYHYRIVATNPTGTDEGDPVSFTTQQAPIAQPGPGDRAYELVSPADKVSGVGVGEWYEGPGAFAATAGLPAYLSERFAVQGEFGSVLVDDGAQQYANDWAFADRVNSRVGWLSHSPVSHPSHRQAAGSANLGALSTADDLASVYWQSNHQIAPFPELAENRWGDITTAGAGALSDWGGKGVAARWEVLGPTTADPGEQLTATPGSGEDTLWNMKLSADGSVAAGTTALESSGLPSVVGLGGSDDPTNPSWGGPAGDLDSGRSVYLADLSGGLADSFAGAGDRTLANVCTGDPGIDRTELPAVSADGEMVGEECGTSAGRATLISDRGATLTQSRGVGQAGPDHAVSADGSRVFFVSPDPFAAGVPNGTGTFCDTAGETCPPQLYVRQRNSDGSVSVRWISHAVDGLSGLQDAELTGSVRFEGATPDGDKVFFRTNSPLTMDDPNGAGGSAPAGGVKTGQANGESWDLYVYDLPDGPDGDPATPDADPAGGELTRISAGPDGDGDCNSPLPSIGGPGLPAGADNGNAGALRFVSDDGERAYFVCAAPLTGVPVPTDGTVTVPGGTPTTTDAANLYVYDGHQPTVARRWRFVARLPRSVAGAGTSATDSRTACATTAVMPGAVFTSEGQNERILLARTATNCVRGTADGSFATLFTTGRLTADDPAGSVTGDVYGYDLDRDELSRISAAQGGAGGSYECAEAYPEKGFQSAQCYGDGGAQANSTADFNAQLGVAVDPLVAGDKIAFFQSGSQLVAEDTDDAYDVYQWRNGKLSLISTGASDTDDAFYQGNDRTGRNVYFATRDQMSWQDFDGVADVYTARVGGGIAQPAEPQLCDALAGACAGGGGAKPVPVSPQTPAPGGGDAELGLRPRIALGKVGRRAARRAARRGVLVLRVRTNTAGAVRAVVRARVRTRRGVRVRRVGRAGVRAERAGVVRLRVKLNRAARRQLRASRRLRVAVRVGMAGAPRRGTTLVLRRSRR